MSKSGSGIKRQKLGNFSNKKNSPTQNITTNICSRSDEHQWCK
jgi:hypothetical protein